VRALCGGAWRGLVGEGKGGSAALGTCDLVVAPRATGRSQPFHGDGFAASLAERS
jgi:hypothetical protein